MNFMYNNVTELIAIFVSAIIGLLDKIQTYFNISDNNSYAGLLQTVFICSYMVLAPIFGYLGDRYRRKYIMAAGILVWSATVFASSLLNSDVGIVHFSTCSMHVHVHIYI